MSDLLFGSSYETEFDPVLYLKTFYADLEKEESKLQFFYQLASDLPPQETLLDAGCGPCVDSVIPFSSKCSKIFMAEYSTPSRRQIEKWRLAEADAHDWSSYFEYAAEKEGAGNWREIEKRVREKIQIPILTFNALQGDVTGIEQGEINDNYPTNFDIVVTSLCLESAASTLDDYQLSLKRVSNLIKPGGYFFMYGTAGATDYVVKDKRFFCLELNEGQVRSALEASGFEIEKWLSSKWPTSDTCNCNSSGDFAVKCRKK